MGNRKQMMDIDKKSTMTSALSDEHQRNWNDEQLHRKIEATERNYDLSRMPLNFEISRGGKIEAIDKRKNIADKISRTLAADRPKQPNSIPGNQRRRKAVNSKLSEDLYKRISSNIPANVLGCIQELLRK